MSSVSAADGAAGWVCEYSGGAMQSINRQVKRRARSNLACNFVVSPVVNAARTCRRKFDECPLRRALLVTERKRGKGKQGRGSRDEGRVKSRNLIRDPVLLLYSPCPTQEIPMNEPKPVKTAIVEPLVRYTPAETARNKKARDIRRKSIRDQNARSKMK